MKASAVFEKTIKLVEDRLTLNTRRQEVVASNIANMDVPGYVAKDIKFEEVLRKSMEPKIGLIATHAQHMKSPDPVEILEKESDKVTVEMTGPVNLEEEMAKLSRNNLEYQFLVTMLNKKFALLKIALTEGGGV
ncbi:MAG: flagellar basal body rod protein FlgB [Syntrophobacterales bacterium]|nr:flagellar basal body rod protein FlgB [Syntrophobacterales bacterium]